MIELLSYWYMFPIAIVISTIAMMAGIGGALFFSPLFIVGLNLEPKLALATSLFIEIFGFSSGVIGYLRAKSINFFIVKKVFLLVILSSFLGVIFASFVSVFFLKSLLIMLLFYLSFKFLTGEKKCKKLHYEEDSNESDNSNENTNNNLKLKFYHYPIFAFGALLLGMISSGLGEINEYVFLKKFRMSFNFSSGTSVFLIAVAAISGVLTHLFQIFSLGESKILLDVFPILLFSIPGVLIGAQLGVASSLHLKTNKLELFVGLLFLFIGIITIYSTFFR